MSALDELIESIRNSRTGIAGGDTLYCPQIDKRFLALAKYDLKNIRTENERLKKAAEEAFSVICKGVQLMPLEQLSEWRGVRAWQEEYGKDGNHENTIQ